MTGALLLGCTCLFAFACAGRAPHQAALGEEIALGGYAFAVEGARPAPNPPPPLSTFRDEPGKKAMIVSIRWHILPGNLDTQSRVLVIQGVLRHQLWIVDSAGRRSRSVGAIPESLARWQETPPNPNAWAVVFHVPQDSRELVLIVENPEPLNGQARVTAVRLGI